MAKMFDGLQVVENIVEKTPTQEAVKANRFVTERALLMVMAATMGLSTMALVGMLAVSA
jgi:hypothetical protein